MIAVIVNTLTVLLGSSIGLLLKKGIPERISNAVMIALGLVTVYIGVDGALKGENTIVLIISIVLGTIIGTLIDIDKYINKLATSVENRFKNKGGKTGAIAEGFMTASLLFCVGAMTLVGSFNAGVNGDYELLFTKSSLDLFSSCMLASSLGIGVLLASVFVLVFQGGIVLASGLLTGIMTDALLVNEIICAGSIMIIGIGLNLIGITKLKVANMLPAMFIVPLIYKLVALIPIFN